MQNSLYRSSTAPDPSTYCDVLGPVHPAHATLPLLPTHPTLPQATLTMYIAPSITNKHDLRQRDQSCSNMICLTCPRLTQEDHIKSHHKGSIFPVPKGFNCLSKDVICTHMHSMRQTICRPNRMHFTPIFYTTHIIDCVPHPCPYAVILLHTTIPIPWKYRLLSYSLYHTNQIDFLKSNTGSLNFV